METHQEKKKQRKEEKRKLKEYLKGKSLKCHECGAESGQKFAKVTKKKDVVIDEKVVGVTLRRTENGYLCQRCA